MKHNTPFKETFIAADQYTKERDYWLGKLSGDIDRVVFPVDYDNRSSQCSMDKDKVEFEISGDIFTRLNHLSNHSDTRLFMVLAAGLILLLHRYTYKNNRRRDIQVGTPVHKQESDDDFINTVLTLRNQLHCGMTFKELLLQVRQTLKEANENQDYPIEPLMYQLKIPYKPTDDFPLFDVGILLENIQDISYIRHIHLNIIFSFLKEPRELKGVVEYNALLYKKETIARIITHFRNLLQGVLTKVNSQLERIDMLTPEEKKRLLIQLNDTAMEYPRETTIHHLFEKQVEQTPTAVALVGTGLHPLPARDVQYISFRELDRKSNQLAMVLREKGIKPEAAAAILLERSNEMIIGILGILKAGGAYLPIAPEYPDARKHFMLSDSNARIVITTKKLSHLLPPGKDIVCLPSPGGVLTPASSLTALPSTCHPHSNLAYVIYTSGSTGEPRGVMMEHGPVINLVYGLDRVIYKKYPGTLHVALIAPFQFDASAQQIFTSLLKGHCLYIIPQDIKLDSEKLWEYYKKCQINITDGTPTYIGVLVENISENMSGFKLNHFLIAGEVLPKKTVEALFNTFPYHTPGVSNIYGPTETCVDSTFYDITRENLDKLPTFPIGKPLPNEQVYILNIENNLQPVGVPGELCIGGDGLARGYLNRPLLTSRKFVRYKWQYIDSNSKITKRLSLPIHNTKTIYKTGDLARWLTDGQIEFLGRMDNQVKIRGFRIELGEIENQLLKNKEVKQTAVLVKEYPTGGRCICAYIVPHKELSPVQLREYLSKSLPDHMIPAYFIPIEKIPLTPNGKMNIKALPEPGTHDGAAEKAPPADEIEKIVKEVWQQFLGVKEVGVNDDFFQLGGDSIIAIQVSARLRKYGLKLEVRDLFINPTIRESKKYIKKIARDIPQETVEGKVVLTPIQRTFFENHTTFHHHFNQAVILYKKDRFDKNILDALFTRIVLHHDALRIVFKKKENEVLQENQGVKGKLFDLEILQLHGETRKDIEKEIETEANRVQQGFNLENGPLVKLALFKAKKGDFLLIVIHHLVVDGVSWRILLEDIETGYRLAMRREEIKFPDKTDSFKYWAEMLKTHAESHQVLNELPYWESVVEKGIHPLPRDWQVGIEKRTYQSTNVLNMVLNKENTGKLLKKVNQAYHTEINDILLTALGLAIRDWCGMHRAAINLESHGRELVIESVVINRTVGWFTAQFPVILDMSGLEHLSAAIKSVKETLRRIPNKGMGYSILKYLTPGDKKEGSALNLPCEPDISFNYLGQFDLGQSENQAQDDKELLFTMPAMKIGNDVSPQLNMTVAIDINGMIVGGRFRLSFTFCTNEFEKKNMKRLVECYRSNLLQLIEHCCKKEIPEVTPADVVDNEELSIEELKDLEEFVELNID